MVPLPDSIYSKEKILEDPICPIRNMTLKQWSMLFESTYLLEMYDAKVLTKFRNVDFWEKP